MRPLSDQRPKPLIPTLGVPQLSWQMAALASAGIDEVIVNASKEADRIFDTARSAAQSLGIEVVGSTEPEGPLGTAGALKRVENQLSDPFLVANADVACDLPLERMIDAHSSSGATTTFLVIPTETKADFVVEEGWITELIDRREEDAFGYLYGGIAVLDRDNLRFVGSEPAGLFETVFKGLHDEGAGMAALTFQGYWLGVDSPEDHLRVNLDALADAYAPRGIPQRFGVEHTAQGSSIIGQASTVEGDLRHCVVGSGATIGKGASLERCVVWEGSEVGKGTYRDCVITPQGVTQVA